MTIHRLSPLVVNQIAAGEVVERPASVVKELIENALDAGATRIEIAIERGGCELIRVTDDGAGIAPDELELALAPHATSKIRSAADLEAIGTLGFRGEALASMAAVSRLAIVSRPRDREEAARIEAEGGEIQPPRPAGGPPGTTVTVRNLFFNTPARRKFLRAEATESARVSQAVEALALAHPGVAFALRSGPRTVLEVPAAATRRQRVLAVLGPELEPELLDVDARDGGVMVSGLAGRPDIARGTARHQRVFLNGRPISDRAVTHAVKEAYRGLIDESRYPTIALYLETDPRQVDVNVHPTKAEVRFRQPSVVHRIVQAAVQGSLRAADLAPAVDFARAAPGAAPGPAPAFGSGLPQKGFVYSEVKAALEREPQGEILPAVRPVEDVLQVHSSYLVTQDEQGLLIIDQHALHERVMFEKLLAAVGKGDLESQRLLLPAMIDVDPAQVELLEQLQPLLRRIGVEAEAAGPAVIAVHAFSSFLIERGVEPPEFMAGLLDRGAREGVPGDVEAALHETLDMMACKAAVKAGDRLSRSEIAELLRHREAVERSSNCPHGRPTTLRLTIRDLERQFGRR